MTKIAMWSGPRSISTALMRSFENRPDTFVSDEPFYAHYLHETGLDHPYSKETIKQGQIRWDGVVKTITGNIPNGNKVWYQKHMAQHNLPGEELNWIWEMENILLIRHPKEVILSYIKKNKLYDVLQLGYRQQNKLFSMLKDHSGIIPHVLDVRDILIDPERILNTLCKKVNIPFYKEMLSWPAGRRATDGIWGKHWYTSVEKSTGFKSYAENIHILPIEYNNIMENCIEDYQQLYQHRIRVR